MNPKISVIIPTYNAENHIEKCLKKACSQTYNEYEIIVVDDGSLDSTLSICEKYAQNKEFIKIISLEHGGVSRARNTGIENASGEYLTFFDADDYPEPEIIEEYCRAFNKWKNNASMVLCGMYWDNVNDRMVIGEKNILEVARGYKDGQYYLIQNHDVSMLSWNKLFNFVTNKCYIKKIIDNYDIRFKEDVHIAEDVLFNLDYLEHASGFLGMINKPLYHYVKYGDDSLSTTYYDGAIEHVRSSFERLLDFVTKQPGVSADDIYVVKSVYLMDWVSRLTMLMESASSRKDRKNKFKFCNEQISSDSFVMLLADSHKGRKISILRYITLKCKRFQWFCALRKVYHLFKRK